MLCPAVFFFLVVARIVLYVHQIVIRTEANPFDSWTISSDPSAIALLGMASISIALTHYYYDSQIYRFSKPAFRNHVLPLLAPTTRTYTSESKL